MSQRAEEGPDPRVDALRATPPRSFGAAREALAKALRDEGKPALAREVRALSRPTVPVFAVNLLARREAQRVRRVLDAARELSGLQRRALDGEGASLASAAARFTEAIEGALAAARRAAEGEGQPLSPAATARVRSTLRALAAGAEAARARLAEGRVEQEEQDPGFASLEAMAEASRPGRGHASLDGRSRAAREAEARQAAEARRRTAAARAALRRAEAKADRLRRRADAARRAADRAAAEAGEADQEVAVRRAELRAAPLEERGR